MKIPSETSLDFTLEQSVTRSEVNKSSMAVLAKHPSVGQLILRFATVLTLCMVPYMLAISSRLPCAGGCAVI